MLSMPLDQTREIESDNEIGEKEDRLDNDDDRKILYLYLDKKRLRDIALTTGISENAVKQRIHRIKQKLIHLNEKKNEQD